MANTQSRQPSTYSFLVHSSSPSSHDAPLDTPKQKRRRTSPQDHAILEAAYLKNSKPDKNERAEIVSQVELGEKEVQIWFQNRRQNDRRKSKPLQPHELLAHFRNGGPSQTSPSADIIPNDHVKAESSNPTTTPTSSTEIHRPSSRSSDIHELLNPPSSIDSTLSKNNVATSSQRAEPVTTPPSSFEDVEKATDHQEPLPAETSSPEQALGHTRKRSHDMMIQPTDGETDRTANPVLAQVPILKKRSSFVRLAMTVDGAVKVRTSDETTPSPPKQRLPPPNLTSRRSSGIPKGQGAGESGFEFKDINPPVRQQFGRSRDARTWEFYCDRDASDALSTQIEAERNGSAIGAINLIRSHSQRAKSHALSPNPMKQNKRRIPVEQNLSKPKIARAYSSTDRIQSLDGASDTPDNGKAKRPRHARSASGDSDKENWQPGTRASHNPMRRMHPSAPRSSVLRDNEARHHRALSGDDLDGREQEKSAVGKEKAKGDDLDCIQGLLSLSQGAWR